MTLGHSVPVLGAHLNYLPSINTSIPSDLTQSSLFVAYSKIFLVELENLPGDDGSVVGVAGCDGVRAAIRLRGQNTEVSPR